MFDITLLLVIVHISAHIHAFKRFFSSGLGDISAVTGRRRLTRHVVAQSVDTFPSPPHFLLLVVVVVVVLATTLALSIYVLDVFHCSFFLNNFGATIEIKWIFHSKKFPLINTTPDWNWSDFQLYYMSLGRENRKDLSLSVCVCVSPVPSVFPTSYTHTQSGDSQRGACVCIQASCLPLSRVVVVLFRVVYLSRDFPILILSVPNQEREKTNKGGVYIKLQSLK